MRGQDSMPTVSSLKRLRFPDSDFDDAVTVLGDTIKRQRTHDSDDGLLAMDDSIRELDDLLHHKGSSSSTTEAYDCWDDDLLGSLIDEFELLPDSAVAASAADEATVVPWLTTHLGHCLYPTTDEATHSNSTRATLAEFVAIFIIVFA
ncbi:hypothetical protein ACFX2I_014681 [Malus domestica]